MTMKKLFSFLLSILSLTAFGQQQHSSIHFNRGSSNPNPFAIGKNASDSLSTLIAGPGIIFDSTTYPGSLYIKTANTNTADFYFNPKDIPGIAAWYDLYDFASITLNTSGSGTRITQINDKSGNGNNLVQSDTTKSPTYQFSGGANGYSYAHLVNATMLNSTITVPQPYTVYMLIKQNTFANNAGAAAGAIAQFGSAATNGVFQMGPSAQGHYSTVAAAAFAYKITDVMNAHSVWNIYKFTFNGLNSTIELNEQLKYLTYYQNNANMGSAGMTQFELGLGSGSTQFDVEEIMVVSGVVPDVTDRSIRGYLFTKYGLANNQYIGWFGDSITAGSALSNSDSSYAYRLTDSLGYDYYNYGIAGTEVYLGANSFLITSNYLRGGNTGWAVIGYGTNDFCLVTAANWKANLESLVKRLINYGYSPSKIIITSPPYQPVKTCLAGTVTQLTAIAADLGVQFADIWTYTQGVGCPLLVDNIHPNGTCNRTIELYLLGFIH